MGIKHFYYWLKNQKGFKYIFDSYDSFIDDDKKHLFVDANSIIHTSTDKVLSLYMKKSQNINDEKLENDIFIEIKKKINDIIYNTGPNGYIYISIDGVAPISKQHQQKQRRFRFFEKNTIFDKTSISAGTSFMRRLSKSLKKDKYSWVEANEKCNFVLSTDKKPGEGEHKIINILRLLNSKENSDTYIVHGLDSDIFLLLSSFYKNCDNKIKILLCRDKYNEDGYCYINIKKFIDIIKVPVSDFIIWLCFVGNDFLPNIESFEIKETYPEINIINFFIINYKNPLVVEDGDDIQLNYEEIIRLFKLMKKREEKIFINRSNDKSRFGNHLWENSYNNIDIYRKKYLKDKFPDDAKREKIIKKYFKTVLWVYLYYTKKIPSWEWKYPYNYTLHAYDFVKYTKKWKFSFKDDKPNSLENQLINIMHPDSNSISDDIRKNIKHSKFYMDYTWLRQEWEAKVIFYP